MRLHEDQLTRLALLALEEAERATALAPLENPYWVRFSLAYLYSVGTGEKRWFEEFWRAVTSSRQGWSRTKDSNERQIYASASLEAIYRSVGVRRDTTMMFRHLDRKISKPVPPG